MKKTLFGMAALALLFVSCNDDQNSISNDDQSKVDMSDFYVYTDADIDEAARIAEGKSKSCYSMVNLNRLLNENHDLEQKMFDIEYQTRKSIAAKKPDGAGNGNGNGGGNNGGGGDPDPGFTDPVSIPVVVNIIEQFSGQVSTQQINSQIAILNEDYNDNNPNTNGVPTEFAGDVADCGISFTLAQVNRVVNTRSSWGTNDAMKDSGQGGIDVTDPSTYLNIWVCEIGGGILGYAQFPGGPSATDGVVIGTDYFGQNNAGGVYGDGRTGTHEVGHWLNLRHIWGDGNCRRDDFVADTPSSDGPNYGCPSYPTVNCRSNDMTMNYMDYVYDDCMYMFTNGQNARMRALFEAGGARASLAGN